MGRKVLFNIQIQQLFQFVELHVVQMVDEIALNLAANDVVNELAESKIWKLLPNLLDLPCDNEYPGLILHDAPPPVP